MLTVENWTVKASYGRAIRIRARHRVCSTRGPFRGSFSEETVALRPGDQWPVTVEASASISREPSSGSSIVDLSHERVPFCRSRLSLSNVTSLAYVRLLRRCMRSRLPPTCGSKVFYFSVYKEICSKFASLDLFGGLLLWGSLVLVLSSI